MAKKLKIPANHIIVGLVAFALLLGAPAIVAMIDDSAHFDVTSPTKYDEVTLFSDIKYRIINTQLETVALIPGSIGSYPSENGGDYLIDSGLTSKYVWYMSFDIGNSSRDSPIDAGARTIVITTAEDLQKIELGIVGKTWEFTQDDEPGVWILNIGIADMILLDNYTGRQTIQMFWTLGTGTSAFPSDGIFEFSIEFYDATIPIFYASFVWGAVGVILLITAIYASHLVKVGDVSKAIKKAFTRKKKGGKK